MDENRPHRSWRGAFNLVFALPRLSLALLLFVAPLARVSAGELEFASAFSSNMVLQRGSPIVVSGHGTANAQVEVSLGPQTRGAEVGKDGHWKVTFNPLPAGGPYAMTLSDGSNDVALENILLGDVWILSGQSNMQMGLDDANGGTAAIAAAAPDIPVRLLSVPKSGAKEPRSKLQAEWKTCTSDSLRKFSAVAWFFAHHLRQDKSLAEVPLGIVDSSFGGTAIEGWTPAGTLPDIPEKQISKSMFGIPSAHLYNGMIAPLLNYRVKGVVWYQGESNAGKPAVYASLLKNMMAQWRERWEQPELPFLIVQLPAYEGRSNGLDFSWLREAQAKACRESPSAWLAVTYDTTNGFDLHPREKEEIGRRLSLLARREVYGEAIIAQGPAVVDISFAGDRAVVAFDQKLATPCGGAVRGFALASADGEFRYAEATIKGRNAVLRADGVAEPRFVRFAWGALPDANLTNEAGLPAATFRTDNRPRESLAFQPLPTVYRIQTPAYLLETGRGGSIASLVVGGKQFLSHEPGGGTSIPGFFGARNLAHTRVLGPRRLVLSDGSASVEIAADESTMTWTVTNQGKDEIEFRVALAPQVEVDSSGSAVKLARDGTTLEVDGVDRVEKGRKLVTKIPAHGSAELRWSRGGS